MKCEIKNRQKTITAYLTGAMTEAEREAFDEHCFECDVCCQELTFNEQAVNLIRNEGNSIFRKYLNYRELKSKAFNLGEILKIYLLPSRKIPAFAFAIVALFVFLFGFQFIIKTFNASIDYPVNFDQAVPSGYGQSALRSESDMSRKDALFLLFNNQYLAGISDYIICDYSSAIKSWKKIETICVELEKNTHDLEFLKTIRNYYYYLGVSNLAISVSKKQRLNESTRTKHRMDAIAYLLKAEALSNNHLFNDKDKIVFYLGTAYGIDGKKAEAVDMLSKLTDKSEYYNQAKELINKWKAH